MVYCPLIIFNTNRKYTIEYYRYIERAMFIATIWFAAIPGWNHFEEKGISRQTFNDLVFQPFKTATLPETHIFAPENGW